MAVLILIITQHAIQIVVLQDGLSVLQDLNILTPLSLFHRGSLDQENKFPSNLQGTPVFQHIALRAMILDSRAFKVIPFHMKKG